ncbi:hypothetical protein KAR91_01560, partial [Candidatus Pacearchaeota archaeon]|nr:hypothetical protein [Candidatus Pacearchaeota archaeon]
MAVNNSFSSYLQPFIIGNAQIALAGNTAFIASLNKDFSTMQNKKGKILSMAVPQTLVTKSFVPSNVAGAPAAITGGAIPIELEFDEVAEFGLTGNQTQEYDLDSFTGQQIRAAVQAVVKKVNDDVWSKITEVSNYYGTAGTGFFASDLNGLGKVDKILTDNFCPEGERQLMCSTRDYEEALALTQASNVNQRGSADVAQGGQFIQDLRGFKVTRDQGAATAIVKGTITPGVTVSAATAAGVELVVLVTNTSGVVAIKQGDIINFGDGNNYSAQADLAVPNSSSGILTLDKGLVTALSGGETIAYSTGYNTSVGMIAGRMDGISVIGRIPEL